MARGKIESEEGGKQYNVHTLTLRDQMEVNILRHQITNGMYDALATSKLAPDRFTAQWAYALAVLTKAIDDETNVMDLDPQEVVKLLGAYDVFVESSGGTADEDSKSRPRPKSVATLTGSPSAR